jgi:hypothetical protein
METLTLKTTEIRSLLGKIQHRVSHRANQLTPWELDFLGNMDYWLRHQQRTTLSVKQTRTLLKVLDRTQDAVPATPKPVKKPCKARSKRR